MGEEIIEELEITMWYTHKCVSRQLQYLPLNI